MKRQPVLLIPVIFLVFGIISANYSLSLLLTTLLTLTISVFIILKIRSYFFTIQSILAILFFLIGYFAFIQQHNKTLDFDILTIGKNIVAIGDIESISEINNNRFKYCVTTKITRIKSANAWINCDNKIQIYTIIKPKYQLGEKIIINDVHLKNINNLEFKKYLTRIDISNTFFTLKLNAKIIKKTKGNLLHKLENTRNNLINTLKAKMSGCCFSLFASTFLGNKNLNKNEMELINQKFAFWGMLHLIARSGLHLWILIFIFQLISFIIKHFVIRRFLLALLMIFFYFISWPAIPFTRSLITYLLFELCNITGVEHDTTHLFLLVCTIILIANPIQVFFLDFQLSFLITYILLWYAKYSFKRQKILKDANLIA